MRRGILGLSLVLSYSVFAAGCGDDGSGVGGTGGMAGSGGTGGIAGMGGTGGSAGSGGAGGIAGMGGTGGSAGSGGTGGIAGMGGTGGTAGMGGSGGMGGTGGIAGMGGSGGMGGTGGMMDVCPTAQPTISFAANIQPYFEAGEADCVQCHSGGTGPKGVNLDSYASILAGGNGFPLVVPCDSSDPSARLIPQLLSSHHNGPDDAGFVVTLSQWIDEGAQDN